MVGLDEELCAVPDFCVLLVDAGSCGSFTTTLVLLNSNSSATSELLSGNNPN